TLFRAPKKRRKGIELSGFRKGQFGRCKGYRRPRTAGIVQKRRWLESCRLPVGETTPGRFLLCGQSFEILVLDRLRFECSVPKRIASYSTCEPYADFVSKPFCPYSRGEHPDTHKQRTHKHRRRKKRKQPVP